MTVDFEDAGLHFGSIKRIKQCSITFLFTVVFDDGDECDDISLNELNSVEIVAPTPSPPPVRALHPGACETPAPTTTYCPPLSTSALAIA